MEADIQPWLFRVEPFEGESLSHFLGRFRRANKMTPSGLGKAAGIGAVVARWEKFRLNPFPSLRELEALAFVVEVEAVRLAQMLPSLGTSMSLSPIRLCGACYAQQPCHKIEGSLKRRRGAISTNCDCFQNAQTVVVDLQLRLYGWRVFAKDALCRLLRWQMLKSCINLSLLPSLAFINRKMFSICGTLCSKRNCPLSDNLLKAKGDCPTS